MRKIAGFGALPKDAPVTVTTQASAPQAAVRHEGGKGLARERWAPPISGLPAVQRAVVENARSMAEAESNDSCVPFDPAAAAEELFGHEPEAAAAALVGDTGSILGGVGDPDPRPEMTAKESLGIAFGSEAVSEGNSIAPFASAPPAVSPPTKKRAPRTKPAPAKAPGVPTPATEPSREQRVAAALGVDLAAACPVCEAVDPCSCLEEERTFARRVRRGFAGILRCPTATCGAPLSVLYLPRVGAPPRHRHLVHYTAVHLCAQCQGDGIAAILGGP